MPVKKYLKESIKLGDRELTVETGRIAKQADGSVVIRYGETMLLVRRGRRRQATRRDRLLPADCRISRIELRRRAHSGQLLPTRRPAERKRSSDLPLD